MATGSLEAAYRDERESRSTRTCCVTVSSVFDLSGSQLLKCKPGVQIPKSYTWST